jgi:hypothetical protein
MLDILGKAQQYLRAYYWPTEKYIPQGTQTHPVHPLFRVNKPFLTGENEYFQFPKKVLPLGTTLDDY